MRKKIRDILGTNYLVTGQTLGSALLILILWPLTSHLYKDQRAGCWWKEPVIILSLIVSSFYIYVLLQSGGRGPLISFGITLFVFYGFFSFKHQFRLALMHACALFMASILIYLIINSLFNHTTSHFMERITPILQFGVDESLHERYDYYRSAWEAFLQHPIIGVGFGGWPAFYGFSIKNNIHPHNIFLELLAETGGVGLLLFIFLGVACIRHLKLKSLLEFPFISPFLAKSCSK